MWRMMVCLSLVMASAAFGQSTAFTVDTEGIATVDIAPTYVEFWLMAAVTGASAYEAMTKALQFEPALRQEIQTRDLSPTSITVTSAAIPDAAAKEVRVSARLQFPTTAFASPDTGQQEFAQLCDDVLALANGAKAASVRGPILGVENPAAVQDTAVQRAIEKAYPTARAAVEIMNQQILAVGKVEVLSVAWNDPALTPAAVPDIRRMTCTARVRVSYIFSMPAPVAP